MAGPDDLHQLALEYLDLCAEALDTIPVLVVDPPALLGAPDRQFVSPGQNPVWDCQQLTVNVAPINEEGTDPGGLDAGRRAHRFARINEVALVGTILRCVPIGTWSALETFTPPTPEDLTAAARQINADGWALWNHLFNAVHSEGLLTLCDKVFFDSLTPFTPQGGMSGWTITARATLGGYSELIGT